MSWGAHCLAVGSIAALHVPRRMSALSCASGSCGGKWGLKNVPSHAVGSEGTAHLVQAGLQVLSALLKAHPGGDDDLMKALQAQLASAHTVQVCSVPSLMLCVGLEFIMAIQCGLWISCVGFFACLMLVVLLVLWHPVPKDPSQAFLL